jgi:aminoglycoside-2''-adenylyltransferase
MACTVDVGHAGRLPPYSNAFKHPRLTIVSWMRLPQVSFSIAMVEPVTSGENGREVDFHVIVLDDQGNGLYGPTEKGEMYPSASLTGTGSINGRIVRCISPEWMVKFHSGYELREKDFRDVSALCRKFGLELPESFAQFKK